MKTNELFLILFVILILFTSTLLLAGTITVPTSTPVPTGYTLRDIYNLIHSNTTSSAGNHSLSTTTTPTATSSYSISQLYADLANLIKRENLATGIVYFHVTGDYGNPDPAYSTTTVISSSLISTVSSGNSWGYSLEDVWVLISCSNCPKPTAGNHDSAPPSEPAGSMHSLTDIYNLLVNIASSRASSVRAGVIYLGQTGTYTPVIPEFAGGDGSSGNPYQIANWTQLNNVRDHLDSYFVLNTDLSSADSDYTGIGDTWLPLGTTTDNKFTGNFDGQNHTISNLTITVPSSNFTGFFGYSTGDISNLGLVNATINGISPLGGLVGYMNAGTISNSYFNGRINSTEGFRTEGIAGLVGSTGGGTISKSYSAGSITNPSGYYVAGLVGYQHGGSISDSYSSATVIGYSYVGGLVGLGFSITNSYSVGAVIGTGGFGPPVGGLVGMGAALNSFFDTETTGQTGGQGTGTTTAAMKTEATFTDAGWDFSTIWTITEGVSYPTLR